MKQIKKNIPLVVGLAIPVLMILFVAGSIYIPRLFAPEPKFNFVYSSGEDYYYGSLNNYYSVKNGKIVEKKFDT